MKIVDVNIPKTPAIKDGLEDIKMEKMGPMVLIAGKNGSGKTRILNKIFQTYASKPTASKIMSSKAVSEKHNNDISQYRDMIAKWRMQIENNKKQIVATNPNSAYLESENVSHEQNIKHHSSIIQNLTQEIDLYKSILQWSLIETSEAAEVFTSVSFVPKNLNLISTNTFSRDQMEGNAKAIDTVGIANLHNGTFAKIQVIQDRWFNATHQFAPSGDADKKTAIEEYERLKRLIALFLNTQLERNINGSATLFNFEMWAANLSDGQKILLQFCVAIFSQQTSLKDSILILDEPENHLHPSVIIETLDRIIECVPNGQIWIATHSIPLLAHFDPSLIWYVEGGRITHAGKIPEKVLCSLLGGEDEIAKLQDFISLPAQYATSRYAFESLQEPGVSLTGSKDPQSFQIKTALEKLTKNGKLRILDYGVGKGRLISNISDLDKNAQKKLIANLDYIAYDKFDKYKAICEATLVEIFGTSKGKYFNDINKLLSIYDKASFQVVVMCNVLHEIDTNEWLKLFGPEGTISTLLSEDGILLLVEDHQIPIGEKAYQKGFLILDTPQLKDLFKISEKDTGFYFTDYQEMGRLKAHHIPQKCLTRIDGPSRTKAIKSLSSTAREEILKIREMGTDYKNGKLHGFWTQQFANAQLNLAEQET